MKTQQAVDHHVALLIDVANIFCLSRAAAHHDIASYIHYPVILCVHDALCFIIFLFSWVLRGWSESRYFLIGVFSKGQKLTNSSQPPPCCGVFFRCYLCLAPRGCLSQIPSGPAAMRLVHVDLFAVEKEVFHVASKGR